MKKMDNLFERYLTIWIGLSIIGGMVLGKIAPNIANSLNGMTINVKDAPVISIPIAIALFFMMYPIMVKIDFASIVRAGKSGKPVFLTLFINWCVKPFTMYAIAYFFLGIVFKTIIGTDAVDFVKMPFGLDLPIGAINGAGTVVCMMVLKCCKSPYGEVILLDAFYSVLLHVLQWCLYGAI